MSRLTAKKAESFHIKHQFFFDEAVTDHVMRTVSPYNRPDTVNRTDRVYNGASLDGTRAQGSGDLTKLSVREGKKDASASLHLVLDLSRRARPEFPPGGLGGPPSGGFGGPPPPC